MVLCEEPHCCPGLLQESHQESGNAANQAQQRPAQQQQRPEAEQQPCHQPPAAALEALQERSRQELIDDGRCWLESAHVAPQSGPKQQPVLCSLLHVCRQ